ncbi:TKL protein kinase, variant [Aphanomyces astaci]|uniref:TKL protein kinase, variant n=1 Tax=Aphanomyces astaci TaxID=112090 RepID=W4H662_APHAT|nr:TKL protein kinase, variant [Aphanomyces astaci]ETV87402.1 TKL protein kinase, variant [Aphanomyces astaci]|eukprot:XP_009822265.1 TKL protein kinase, variant [Aphanomyces astaci]
MGVQLVLAALDSRPLLRRRQRMMLRRLVWTTAFMGTTAAQNAISADKPACDVNPGALLTKPTLSSRCEQLCTAASLDLLQQAVAKPPPYCLVVDGKLFSAQNTTQDVFTLVDVTKLASSVSHIEGLPSIGLSIYLNNLGVTTMNKSLAYRATKGTDIRATLLDISSNLLTTLSGTTFPSRLMTLIADNNQLTDASNMTAPALSILQLKANEFTAVPSLSIKSLVSLNMDSNAITSLTSAAAAGPWQGIPNITTLSFAHNRLTDLPSTWPPYLQTLNLQHNALTKVNFTALPPSLSFVCLGGNNLTLIAASSAAFEVLKKLSQPHADAGHASSTCDDSAPFASPNLPTPQCPPPTKLETLWGVYPICVTPPTTSSSLDGSKSGASVVVVSVALALIMLLLLAICIQRRRARLSPNWYDEVDHKYYGAVDAALVDNDVRFDDMYAAFQIPAPSIVRHHVLARGGFGIVYLATLHPSPAYPILSAPVSVAMKRMLPEKASELHSVEDFMEEIRLSARLYHKNIVKFIGFSWTTLQNLSALTEYMEHGDLWNYMQATPLFSWGVSKQVHVRINRPRRPPPPPPPPHDHHPSSSSSAMFSKSSFSHSVQSLTSHPASTPSTSDEASGGVVLPVSKFTMLCDVVEALVYLHSMDPVIIHRDLKTKNVLLNGVGVAKLTDFGVSRETSEDTMTAEIGTVAWIAPEVLKGIYYSEKADIYSLGVLISEMDTAEVPYSNLDQIFPEFREPMDIHAAKTRIAMLVVAGDLRPSLTPACPPCIVDIASRCLSYDPHRRPHIHQVWDWLNQVKHAMLAAAAGGV